jgi:hypothetical protein
MYKSSATGVCKISPNWELVQTTVDRRKAVSPVSREFVKKWQNRGFAKDRK